RSWPLLIAPVELDDLGRTSGQIPVAAEATKARLVGARYDDVRADPVFAVADDDVLAFLLAAHRRDGAAAIFFQADDARLALRLVADRNLVHAEELPDQDRQQMRCAADAAGEDARQALDRLDRRLVVDEQRRRPVAARHDAGQVHHQPGLDARQIDVLKI